MIEQAATLAIQVTPSIGLQPVREGAEQQMARKMRRRSPAEHNAPTAAQPLDIEIAQLRNLGIQRRTVWQRSTDPDTRHGGLKRSDVWIGETPQRRT